MRKRSNTFRSKSYGANKVDGRYFKQMIGRRFDSKLERAVGESLSAREYNGEISDLKFQVQIHLTRARIGWRVDFSYIEDGKLYYHEAKGFDSETYRIKLRLFKVYGDAPLRISKGSAKSHRIIETVFPEDYLTNKGQ